MALPPGTRLGVYVVTAPIGEGGMGQVYRARDTRLDRDVAIKILPPAFANDPDRLVRFTREAKVLASLNHPNIAAIYGLEDSAPSAGSGQPVVRALVMELVEGEDLSQRIARGAIPFDEALPIATQIAEALEAAHEQGIVHRDLKPANIKVRADGTVKVLDFGLAKALTPEGSGATAGADVSQSPTFTTPPGTAAGMILGTAAYMSPEQARGKAVDKRADIWAFGCVLFEMLTAAKAFAGGDAADVLSRVLQREPDLTALPAGTPMRVQLLVARCLVKDPRQRVRDIGDARLALLGAFETAGPMTAPSATPSASRGRPGWMVAAAAVLLTALVSIPAVRYLRHTPLAETRTEIVTSGSTEAWSFALSPDGRQVAFVASEDGVVSRLWIRSLATTTAHPLSGTDGAQWPFWSPDSRSVGFFAESTLKRIDVSGGAPQAVATAPDGRGATWNADGVILFAPSYTGPLVRVPASGKVDPVAVTTLDREVSHRFPSFLPDGRHFLFYAQGPPDTAGIYLGSLDARDTYRLTESDAAGLYLSSGWLLWVRAGTLAAQRLDLDRQALMGDRVNLADSVAVNLGYNVGAASTSAGGLVAYRTTQAVRRQLAWVDRSGRALGALGVADENGLQSPRVSPDGRRVAMWRAPLGQGDSNLWLLDGLRKSRFTFGAAIDEYPVWSPDGRWLAFGSNRTGFRDLYRKSSSGAETEELLLASAIDKEVTDWSADGRFLLYVTKSPAERRNIWVLPLEVDRAAWVFLKSPFDERGGTFSPDGRWVAYMSNESGRMEIYIRPFGAPAGPLRSTQAANASEGTAAGGQWQVSTVGGIAPRWRHDGKELYYIGPTGTMMAAPIAVIGAAVAPGTPVALFPTQISGGGANPDPNIEYDVTSDGRFLINTVLDEAVAPITLVQNWKPDAKK